MTISYQEVLQTLSPEQRQTVETRAAELIAEEMTLRDLRKARSLTQEKMAELLQIRQENVSRIEHRTDLLLSTLREYIEAMGGELDLVVKFHDRLFSAKINIESTTRSIIFWNLDRRGPVDLVEHPMPRSLHQSLSPTARNPDFQYRQQSQHGQRIAYEVE
jgi:transcriptional regulator with XRE-family HTH domain